MCDVYAIYDPETDRVVGIYGTNRSVDVDRRRMLETVTEPGTHWHKESQVNRESWEDPARLEFVFLENFSERSDRNRLVKQWRTQRFREARSIAKGLSGRGAPRTGGRALCTRLVLSNGGPLAVVSGRLRTAHRRHRRDAAGRGRRCRPGARQDVGCMGNGSGTAPAPLGGA